MSVNLVCLGSEGRFSSAVLTQASSRQYKLATLSARLGQKASQIFSSFQQLQTFPHLSSLWPVLSPEQTVLFPAVKSQGSLVALVKSLSGFRWRGTMLSSRQQCSRGGGQSMERHFFKSRTAIQPIYGRNAWLRPMASTILGSRRGSIFQSKLDALTLYWSPSCQVVTVMKRWQWRHESWAVENSLDSAVRTLKASPYHMLVAAVNFKWWLL